MKQLSATLVLNVGFSYNLDLARVRQDRGMRVKK